MKIDTIEQDIQAKGLTAPRVTLAEIEAEIVSTHFFTAAQGDAKMLEDGAFANGVTINAAQIRPIPPELGLLTFCVLILRNGFTVTGESACASPENFNAEIGRKIAFENAAEKVWMLLGFRLRDKLAASTEA
ncbi:Gp49 family protein [Dyella sp.]|uniref:Gp49 family protein n=1 Tax=Dyella sp. TaxID=1869338 RepID=UPI002FDAACCB